MSYWCDLRRWNRTGDRGRGEKVLDKAGEKYGHSFTYQDILMGGCSIDATGVPLTDEAIAAAKASDAVLMGSIGGNTQTSHGTNWLRN